MNGQSSSANLGTVVPVLKPLERGGKAGLFGGTGVGKSGGGDDQDRTDGLLIANQTLSQLSYTPTASKMLNRNLQFGKG